MRYYDCGGYPLCSREVLALPALHALPETGEVLFGFHRTPGIGRDTFPVTAPSLLTAEEGGIDPCDGGGPETDPALAAAIADGRVRAVNLAHPDRELLPPLRRRERVRVNLLALGDVGSTLLMGLRLLGGDVIDSIGICDVRENVPQRWEMELNQIVSPEGERLPPVELVSPEEVFDGDVFLFCASRFVPDTSVTSGDVRMAQYQVNRGTGGPLCPHGPAAALWRNVLRGQRSGGSPVPGGAGGEQPGRDGPVGRRRAVFPSGAGLRTGGHAGQSHVLCPEGATVCRLSDGGAYLRPHGADLVVANSIEHYDDALSRELTERVVQANLEMRRLGVQAPMWPRPSARGAEPAGLSAGAVALLVHLSGWGVYGGQKPAAPHGDGAGAAAALPEALQERLRDTMERLRAIR